MKKNLLIIFMCIFMVFMAVSCDDHIHTYSEDWTSDETHHWHAATCEHKDEKYGYAEHTFEVSKENAESEKLVKKCTVCGYVSKDEIKEGVFVSNTEELQEAVKKEGTNTVYLANDIEITGGFSFSKSLTLDLNGKKLSLKRDESNIALWVGDFSNTAKINVTIKNGTLEAEAITKEASDVWDYYLIMVWKENTLTLENITYDSNTDTDYKTLFYVSTEGGSYIEGESLSPTLNIINSDITTSSEFGVYIPQERHYTNFATLYIENSNITNNAAKGKAVFVNNAKVVVKGEFDISKIDAVCCSIKRLDSTVYYGTLETAVYDAKEGETITLLKDVDLTNYAANEKHLFNLKENVTVDLNNHTIKTNNFGVGWNGNNLKIQNGTFEGTGSYALFLWVNKEDKEDQSTTVSNNVYLEKLTCKGINVSAQNLSITDCVIDGSGTTYRAIWAQESANVTIKSGTYIGGGYNILGLDKSEGVKISIEGGIFKYDEGKTGTLFYDENNPKKITIAGGVFPADPNSFLVEGYKATEKDGIWTVSKNEETE